MTFSRSPRRPAQATRLLQAEAATAAGRRYGYTPAASEREILLEWPAMLAADYAALRTFFVTTTSLGSAAFTYTDAAGVAVSVRFLPGGTIAATEVTPDSYRVSLTLQRA